MKHCSEKLRLIFFFMNTYRMFFCFHNNLFKELLLHKCNNLDVRGTKLVACVVNLVVTQGLRRGKVAPPCWCSACRWGSGAVAAPGSSCGSSTRVHSPAEYSYVAGWGKLHTHSLCDPPWRPGGHVVWGLQPAVSQTPSSPAPAPSDL